MSRIRANTIVNGAGTGAPNFPRGAIISGISTINAEISVGTGTSISSPDTNVLTLGTNNVERLRITSNGNIGINTDVTTNRTLTVNDSNSIIEIKSPGVDADHYCQLYFNNPGTSSQATAAIWRNPSSNAAYGGGGSFNFYNGEEAPYTFYTGGVNERVRIQSTGIKFPAGNGIDFSSSEGGSATSSLLDDYEEGTWTPIFSTNTNGASSQTYSVQTGKYTKVGRVIHCFFDMMLSNKGTFGGSYITLGGLPYTNLQAGNSAGTMTIAYYSGFNLPTGCSIITGYGDASYVYIMTPSDSLGSDYLTVSDASSQMTSVSRLIGHLTLNLTS
jgi:hypothetical protein